MYAARVYVSERIQGGVYVFPVADDKVEAMRSVGFGVQVEEHVQDVV